MSGILNHQSADCEFIVVGSGAGGGTIAARLAEAGRTVLLLEAGGDPRTLSGADELSEGNRLPEDYDVPAFHAFASENEAMKWDYYVRHYADRDFQQRDPKYVAAEDGILYPRAGTLGGCTAHNAMILAYPQNSDWDDIASLTGDETWNADHMRTYFERLERCRHRPLYRWLSKAGINPTRHGFEGWLSTERAVPVELLVNRALAEAVATGAIEAFAEEGQYLKRIHWALESGLDFNDWRLVRDASTGIRYLPLTTNGHARVGTRERVLDVACRFPERLRIELNTLVTRVLFDDGNRAIGVECQRGQRLYRAHANPNAEAVTSTLLYASREVILAGGAFNSPQLLMLSGIGPREVLQRFNIPLRMELPGVGRNLQDRYEIAVVNRMKFDAWKAYSGARFDKNDQQFREWKNSRGGIYSTNGSVLTIFRHSRNGGEIPDLFCMSLLARFAGYVPGYSRVFAQKLNYLTWVVLKAHARNRSGEVTLRSADPRDPPQINFNYFQNGGEEDLAAVLDGIRFVRRLSANLKAEGLIAEEEMPGEHLQSDEELKEFVRTHAWGHHASCSCPIGPIETGGVLSSDFRVHGVRGLRVVDASIFPRIPGFFIVSAIYTVAEKAAAVILQDLA